MALYAIPFTDGRERHHVAAVEAANPQVALDKLIAYQCANGPGYQGAYYNGFYYDDPPDLEDVKEINPALDKEDQVQILWNEAYD